MKKMILAICMIVFLVLLGIRTDREVPINLVFGWVVFLFRVVPHMALDWGSMAVGAVALVLFTGGLHLVGRAWNQRAAPEQGIPGRKWKVRWSLSLVALLILLFATGTSLIGVMHQTAWLLLSKEPRVGSNLKGGGQFNLNALRQIGIAMHGYASAEGSLPKGGTFAADGSMLHSWETAILPYIAYDTRGIDLEVAWNHPKNEAYFRSVLPLFINSGFRTTELQDAQGFGLSHYAANSRVLAGNQGMRIQDISDGTSTTLLLGEVNSRFQPWGHPVNWRDPAKGINKSADGFGGPPHERGAYFTMADGSVRFVSEKVSPDLLRALATPNGGEEIDVAMIDPW